MIEHVLPGDIEKRSFEIIASELKDMGICLDPEQDPVIRRAIHTSADFDYAKTLVFSDNAVCIARKLIAEGADIVTDTNMALTGINKKRLAEHGGHVKCYMAEEAVAMEARSRGVTRAVVSMEHAASDIKASGRRTIFAVGNAPTALITAPGLKKSALQTGVPETVTSITRSAPSTALLASSTAMISAP